MEKITCALVSVFNICIYLHIISTTLVYINIYYISRYIKNENMIFGCQDLGKNIHYLQIATAFMHAYYMLAHDCSITLINIDVSHMVYNIMMEEITITVIKCTCERCGGAWTILKGAKPPRTCRVQTCRSPYWNKPVSRSKVSRISKSVRAGTYRPKK